jgi:hypothetical protein
VGRKRQLILMSPDPDAEPGEPAMRPLGPRAEVVESFAGFNTAADGSGRSTGTEVLHGPGFVVEIASGQDEVMQAMITVNDEEIAWPVLSRLCRGTGWKMADPETGRTFG